MYFIDTVIFVAFFIPGDQWHRKSVPIVRAIDDGKLGEVMISDYILDEVLTFIRREGGAEKSNRVLDTLLKHPRIKLEKIDGRVLAATVTYFQRYGNLSFTDASTVAVMRDKEVTKIFSFDSDFDSVRGIERMEGVEGL